MMDEQMSETEPQTRPKGMTRTVAPDVATESSQHIDTEAIRTEGIMTARAVLTGAYSVGGSVDLPERHLGLVASIFEALGDLMRWEYYGHSTNRHWPQRVTYPTLEELIEHYRGIVRQLPRLSARVNLDSDDIDDDDTVAMLSQPFLARDEIESGLLTLMRVCLERGQAPVMLHGFRDLLAELREWDADIAKYVSPEDMARILWMRPPRQEA